MAFGLLEEVSTDERFEIPAGEVLVKSIVPTTAITSAYTFEYGFMEASREEAEAAIRAEAIPGSVESAQDVEIANAYYYNSTTNNTRREVVCSGNHQPWYGWRVCTTPGILRCECNYFYKHGHCCHLVDGSTNVRHETVLSRQPTTLHHSAKQCFEPIP
ncbi:unnamed protein product [Aphanomyces euteiches]